MTSENIYIFFRLRDASVPPKFCPSDSSPGGDDPHGRCGPRRRNTMDANSTSERVADADVVQGHQGHRRRQPPERAARPVDVARDAQVPRPRPADEDARRPAGLDHRRRPFDGRRLGFERDLPRRQQGRRHRVHRLAGRRGSPGLLADQGTSRVHGRERHLGPDRLSERPGLRGPGPRTDGRAEARARRRRPAPGQHADLQRCHGRDAGRVRRPAAADGPAALVGHQAGRRGGGALPRRWACAASTSTPIRTSTGCRT